MGSLVRDHDHAILVWSSCVWEKITARL